LEQLECWRRKRGFTFGRFDPDYLRSTSLMIALDGEGTVQGFVNITPSYKKDESTSNLMRRRAKAPHGLMDYLFVHFFLPAANTGYYRCAIERKSTMQEEKVSGAASRFAWAAVAAIALGKLALNMAFAGRYGYFRDELYYIACSRHLAWGYVDQPPLCAGILALTRALLGDSLYAIRFPAALAGAAIVVLVGLMVHKLGGGRFAQILAVLAAALSPVVLGNAGRYFSMNSFDLLFWTLASYITLVILLENRPRWWLWFGLTAGLGLLNKYSMGFYIAGLTAGLLLTPQRKHLQSRFFWLGALLAFLLFLPHLLWQVSHDFPSLEFMRRAAGEKNVRLTLAEFFSGQLMQTGLGQSLLWVGGVAFFFFTRKLKSLRPFGWCYLAVFAIMLLTHAKVYYLTPIYGLYIAAGALGFSVISATGRWRLLRPALVFVLIALSLAAMPFAIPVLKVEDFIAYSTRLGMTPKPEEHSTLAELPQYYADMFGWEEMIAQVAGIYNRLSPEEKRDCVIYVRNYGEAGAIDFFGKKYGLPPTLCGHNSYWYWKPDTVTFAVAIVFGAARSLEANLTDLQGPGRFEQAELAATTCSHYAMPYENNRQIFLCRRPHFTFEQIWPREKNFI